uniref:Uncharacterized protein n=1 Tax=Rhodnius prolixus TaxID=13249 RepID=T1HPR6_RHOPR
MQAAVEAIISDSERNQYEECDRVKREAEIFFYDDEVTQGALVAEFEDGTVRTITKAKEEYGQLTSSKERPPIVRGTKIFRIVSIKTSPHEFLVVIMRRLNDKDHLSLFKKNFQHWTKAAIEAIGLNVPRNGINLYFSTEIQVRFSLYLKPLDLVLDSGDRLQHWALVAEFEDGSVRILQALWINQQLMPTMSPKNSLTNSFRKHMYYLFAMKTSEQELRNIVGRISLNYTEYKRIENNCSHWVESAIKEIGLNLARVLPKEHDSSVREALFSLFSVPVHDVVLGKVPLKTQHLALVAVFEDGSVRTLEALKIDGKLTPTFSKEMPSKVWVTKIQRFGPMKTSPFKLREAAERNSLNDTDYHAVKNNCLHWVKAVIKDIGLELAKALPNEFDHSQRLAQFFLHSRPLDYVVSDNGYYLEMQHWALVAVFEDESIRTLEAFNSDRTLNPKYLKQRPSDVDVTKIRHIGSMEISPYTLRKVAERNSLNGTDYDAIKNNYQHWVESAIKDIGLNLARALLDDCDSTVREAQFFLYSREIRDDVLGHSYDKEMHHWALVAIFEDGSVRTMEAINSDRTLSPTFSKERPSEVLVTKIRRVGSMKTSPQKLREVARKNSLNGTDYDEIENNGEHWSKEAIKAIGLKLPRALPEEYDSAVREAEFFLYPKPLNNFVFKHSVELQLQHWSLVAIFEDGSVRTLEAINTDKKLIPSFSKERPSHVDDNSIRGLGSKRTSPLKLRQVAERNSLNYTRYGPINNNCQNWFKAAVTAISPDLAQVLDNYRTNGEINSLERAGKCLLTSSRSSKNTVASTKKFTRNDLKLSLFQHWKIIVFIFILFFILFFFYLIYVLNK